MKHRVVVHFDASHIDKMEPGEALIGEYQAFQKTMDAIKSGQRVIIGDAFTGMVDGTPIAFAGIVRRQWKNATAWVIPSKNIGENKIWFHKMVKEYFNKIIEKRGYKRVDAVVNCEFQTGIKWIERLGFKRAARLEAFGPNAEPYFLYASIIDSEE